MTLGQRVLFGTGAAAASLASEVARLGVQRVIVITSDRARETACTVAADVEVALWHHDVVMHVSIETAEKARAAAGEHGIDLLVCVGGGSTTGLAKAIAMTLRLSIIAVPTTYAGSEATNVWLPTPKLASPQRSAPPKNALTGWPGAGGGPDGSSDLIVNGQRNAASMHRRNAAQLRDGGSGAWL